MALVGCEVGVARAEGQAVGVSDDGTDFDLGGEAEVADQLLDDERLLVVFLAEEGAVGGDDLQQLEHDGRDAPKMGGTRGAFERLGDGADIDKRLAVGGDHLFGGGGKDEPAAELLEQVHVLLQRARVFFEVFAGGKLGWVDEDAGDGEVATGERGFDQAEVSGVEGAHCGDEADGFAGVLGVENGCPRFCGGSEEAGFLDCVGHGG